MISVAEAARRHGVTPRRIQALCSQGRIPGAVRGIGGAWLLPDPFTLLPPPRRCRPMTKIKA